LTIRKAVENYCERRIKEYQDQVGTLMHSYLMTGFKSRHLLFFGNGLKFAAIEGLLVHYSRLLESVEIRQRIQAYAEQHFSGEYRRRLNHRSWSQRMKTLYRIEDFHMISFESEIIGMLENCRKRTSAELIQLLKILASFRSEKLKTLLPHLHTSLPHFACRDILSRLDKNLFMEYVDRFEDLPLSLQIHIIDVIGIRKLDTHQAFLEQLLNRTDAEIRIRALKALSHLSLVAPKEEFLRHTESDHWQERLMAAKLFGQIRHAMFIPCLKKMLSDSSWWVRYEAGQTLLLFPGGRQILTQIAESGTDRFAREMAAECLERGTGVEWFS
jgi:HEAT repeat protein